MPAVSAVSRRNTTVFTSTLVLLMLLIKKRKQVREQRQPRRWWIRPVFWARKQEGLYHTAGTFFIVLMAVVDSDCKYVLVDVGAEGRQSDGGIFKESSFGCDLSKGHLDIPAVGTLPGTSTCVPYAFVGDEAFQLRKDFMRPYPAKCLNDTTRIFNYRLRKCLRHHCCQVEDTASHHKRAAQPCGLRRPPVSSTTSLLCTTHMPINSWTEKTVSETLLEGAGGMVCNMCQTTVSLPWLLHRHETTMVMQVLQEGCSPATFLARLARFLGSGIYQD
ncbi:hypothetical protein HPB51_005194 [Rhipicephalus microplus]|uniref:DDE Tnp4 domain-containing protein n=1 Tax=Rhipicephalus microplus TaxID=6941 RepID=A0A9J6DFS7_RHIMP|nr:hypothetical protein HPB51_005194 [Rhipicephalus microplus]